MSKTLDKLKMTKMKMAGFFMFQVLENFSFIYPLLCTPCRHVLHNINMVTSYCLLGSDFGVVSLCVLTINFKYYTLFYNL